MFPLELAQYRPKEIDKIKVAYPDGKRHVTCFCGACVSQSIVPHMRKKHQDQWTQWKDIFIRLNEQGYSWKQIMKLFRLNDGKLLFSWTVIEKSIREDIETGRVYYHPAPIEKVNQWQPENFELEKTTVWNFPQRGTWAVHTGDYRGNWPPQLARNLILQYTNEGDLLIDAFAGGGTTLIESWLLNRKSIGTDISRYAIQTMNAKLTAMENLALNDDRITLNPDYHPQVLDLSALKLDTVDFQNQHLVNNGIKLICAHPPYLDSVKYTHDNSEDLSLIDKPYIFYEKMRVFAQQAKKLLATNGICALLIGDVRKKGATIPLGLNTLKVFLSEGFNLKDLIIKTQNKDRSSEFWTGHESNILLMAHEYLLIFIK